MNDHGKSDESIVPEKLPNKGGGAPLPAEEVEGKDSAEENPGWLNKLWMQSQEGLQSGLDRVRQAAKKDRKLQFNSLWHHVYNPSRLRAAYLKLKRKSAPGVDGETWQHYRENLVENIFDLSERLKRGAYRAKPVKRVYIPKADGR
jgi:hypothetical protein